MSLYRLLAGTGLQVTGETTLRGGIRHETNFWQKRTKSTISVGDTERDSQNEIIYRIVDKNNATLMSEEAYFNADGSRDLRFNGRNRANDAWRLFLTIKEFANEEVRIIAADSPISSLNDHTLVTAKWVNEKNFAKDSSVVHLSGNETISDKKTFTYPISVAASTGFEVVRTDQDLKTIPSSDVQTWYGRYKDKNNLSELLIKHYQRESGETSVSLTDINYYHTDDNNGDWSSLTIGHNPDGTRYIKAFYDPIDSINEYEVITAKWLRKYIWNPDGAQVVHTVNDESISGVKTFTRSISVSANPLIQSSHWTGISVFDSTRSNGSQKILAQVLDKDGKRFISLEVSANTDGGRTLHINGRNREDSWWTTLAKFTEKGDGTIVGELGGSPVTDSNDNSIATTGFSIGKEGNRGNCAGFEVPVVQATALTINERSRDSNLVTGAVKITVSNGAANQSWTKTVAISNASATISLGSSWKWYGGAAPDVSANCVLVLHWCSTFGLASLLVTS